MSKRKTYLLSSLIIAVFVIMALGCGSSSTSTTTDKKAETTAPAEAPIVVTADQLASDYISNEISADTKYKGKTLQVTGVIGTIAKGIGDQMYVTLKGPDNNIVSIQCFFEKDQVGDLGTLAAGQTITLQGKGDGKSMNVIMNGCKLVK